MLENTDHLPMVCILLRYIEGSSPQRLQVLIIKRRKSHFGSYQKRKITKEVACFSNSIAKNSPGGTNLSN